MCFVACFGTDLHSQWYDFPVYCYLFFLVCIAVAIAGQVCALPQNYFSTGMRVGVGDTAIFWL